MDRVTADDARFFAAETATSHMQHATIAIFDGPPPPYDEIRTRVAATISSTPRYRQRILRVPGDLHRPVWADDQHFNIGYHLRHSALPAPGSDEQLRHKVNRVMSQQLDRTKPLWELWMVEGLRNGRWMLLAKEHLAIVDATLGRDLIGELLDENAAATAPAGNDFRPEPIPSSAKLASNAVLELITDPLEQARRWQSINRSVARSVRRLIGPGGRTGREAPVLSGPVGPHRDWAWTDIDLAGVRSVRERSGASINDVVLALITAGFRHLLSDTMDLTGVGVRALVPLAVSDVSEMRTGLHRVSGTEADLPIGVEDPVQRLMTITAGMARSAREKRAVAGEVLASVDRFSAPMMVSLGARAAVAAQRRRQPFDAVVTNVPGPQRPFNLMGRQLLSARPFAPIPAGLRIAIGVISYDGRLGIGVTTDADGVLDGDLFVAGLTDGLDELDAALGPSPSREQLPHLRGPIVK